MKSRDNNNQNKQHRTTSHENQPPRPQRRLKTKPTLMVMAILFIGNIFWFALWIVALNSSGNGGEEIVATISGEGITRQEWMATMESLYGKETLHTMVNEAVMERAAKEYDITVTDAEIDLEIALMSSLQDHSDTYLGILEEQHIRQRIRAQLILEKVLTKDIVIEESEVADVYEENKSLYNTPTTYRTSIIIVNSLDEAKHVQSELNNGSDFSLVARERSIDASSASLGGSIGYITTSQTYVDPEIQNVVQNLNADEMSEPFALSDGNYGIVYVSEINEGKSLAYEEVKGHIKTELAMEQLPTNVTTEMFWEEFNVTSYFTK